MANEAVRHLKDAEFRAFLEEKSVALVDFWASWCGPCDFGVMSIPTVVLFKDGKEVERLVGVRTIEDYKAVIDAHL